MSAPTLGDVIARLERLEEENRTLRHRLEAADREESGTQPPPPAVMSRRHWLATGAAVALGATAATIAGAAQPAAAADGAPLLIGNANAGTNSTTIHANQSGNIFSTVFGATNDSFVQGTGLFGWGASYGTLGFSAVGTGLWGKASGDDTHAAVGTGGYIDNDASPGSIGVHGEANGLGQYGVRANSTAGTAMYATSDSGVAVSGASGSSTGVYGTSTSGYAAIFASRYCDLGLGSGTRAAPTGDSVFHYWGDLVAESNSSTHTSTAWYCVTQGTPGTWRRLAAPNSVGALTLLDAPVRVYDSRAGQPPVAVGPKAPLDNGVDRSVDCTGNASGVPADALGVVINLTATGQSAAGYLSVRAAGAAYGGTSNLNWTAANATIANGCTVKCGTGASITLRLGGAAATANVIVDVVGYYL